MDKSLILNPRTYSAQTVCNITRGELQCAGPECYDKTKKCDFKSDCSDGTDESMCAACDFEDFKLCGYYHDKTADVSTCFDM